MTAAAPPPPPAPPSSNEEEGGLPAPAGGEELFDSAQLKRQLGFAVHAVQRHRTLFFGVLALLVGLTLFFAVMWPRTYKVQTKILAQRNSVLASLGNPRRAIPLEADAPTRAAAETVMRRDNLVALVKQTGLVDSMEASRSTLGRLKERLTSLMDGPPTEQDRLEGMVLMLEKRFKVTTEEGVVTIALEWPDARMAYRLIETAQQNFLESRHVTEISSIEDAISILEAHADNVQGSIERTLQEIQKLQSGSGGGNATQPASDKPMAPLKPQPSNLGLSEAAPEQGLVQLRFLLRAKQRAISDLEEFRQKRLAELQAVLAEQKVVYAENHPVIRDTLQRIAALKDDSPQIVALRADEQELLAEYRRRGGGDPDTPPERTPLPIRRGDPKATPGPTRSMDDAPQLAYARQQLRIATETYQDILLRIDAARIELDTTRAAFKYRYSVINPARMPKKAESPNVPLVLIAGAFFGVLFAVAAAVLADLRRGRFEEAWQIEQRLGVPLLAEVKRS